MSKSERADPPLIEPFSAGYDLVGNAEVFTAPDDEASMDFIMHEALEQVFGRPLVGKIDNLHYQFNPIETIPSNAVAVPERNHDDPEALLIKI